MNLPTLRQLQYFIALSEYKSFGRAATACNITQSTLSAGIKELETIMGVALIDRSTRRFALTPFGRETLKDATRLIDGAESMMQKAQMQTDPFSGTLRLGAIPTIAPYAIPEILPVLQKAHPNLKVEIFEDVSARIVEQIQHGQLDMILLAFPYDIGTLDSCILKKEAFVVACPKGYFKKKTLTLRDLQEENVLLLENGHCLRDHALEACSLAPQEGRKTFGATSLPTLIEMVRHGYGITLLPEMAAKSVSGYKDMDILPFSSPKPTREIGLAWRRGSPVTSIQKDISTLMKTGLLQI
jgi:LysR family hydrogen peroxide-inducible transcriptional activator